MKLRLQLMLFGLERRVPLPQLLRLPRSALKLDSVPLERRVLANNGAVVLLKRSEPSLEEVCTRRDPYAALHRALLLTFPGYLPALNKCGAMQLLRWQSAEARGRRSDEG